MPAESSPESSSAPDREALLAVVSRLTSERKVRPVVTRSGQRARGNFPSIKSPARARYESLLELDVLRVAEVSSLVHVITTHPVVLALPGEKVIHYTPDALLQWPTGGVLIETKASYFLTVEPSRSRIQEVVKRLDAQGVRLALLVESDVRPPGLQDELKTLLRLRPNVGRRRLLADTSRWDPLTREAVDGYTERRWCAAQKACDELLARVMRRDPGEFIASLC